MIELRRQHTPFAVSMEVLASVPRFPDTVPVTLLAKDLEFDEPEPVIEAIRGLQEAGSQVEMLVEQEPRVACLASADWEHARAAGEAYLRAVYGLCMHDGKTVASSLDGNELWGETV
jgi:hypothetical protein